MTDTTVLFVSPDFDIGSPSSGEGLRLKELSQRLSDRMDVRVLVPDRFDTEHIDWSSKTYTFSQWSHPFLTDINPAFVRAMYRTLRDVEVDVIHLSRGVCSTRLLANLAGSSAATVYAAQNVEANHAGDFVDETLPAYKRVLGPRLIPFIERLTVNCADYMTTVSEKDADEFASRYSIPSERIRAIPTGTTDLDESNLTAKECIRERYDLNSEIVAVFHGDYSHPPNRDAAEFIRTTLALELEKAGIDIQFLLVGNGMPEHETPLIQSAGYVNDLFSVLNVADLAVVPIRHGGGTKTKIYDYISLQIPMVLTEKSAEGIDLKNGIHATITESVNGTFLEGIVELASDGTRRKEMRSKLSGFSKKHSWIHSADKLAEFYESIASEGPSYGD